MKIIPPGSKVGILGGGQLGRMTALAAARLGYRTHVFCQDRDEPAVAVSSAHTIADFNDEPALDAFAKSVDVVTLEWENLPLSALRRCAQFSSVFPSANVLEITQDRIKEKSMAREMGLGTTHFHAVHSSHQLEALLKTTERPSVLKSTRMGYDGKGQVLITKETSASDAWNKMGSDAGILEAFVDFSCEISVIVARRDDGQMAYFPPVLNIHRQHILAETHAPATLDPIVINEAVHAAKLLADRLHVVGLLAVEMFVLKQVDAKGHHVLINETAPRPHNSGHWTLDACCVSQFEQLIRAVCGLPLASGLPHSRAVMHNLIGDNVAGWPDLLKDPTACLHLYGKKDIRAGRKMGHVTYLKGPWD